MKILNDEKKVFGLILIVSSLIIAFLFWLIYFNTGANYDAGGWVTQLPLANALLNSLTAIFLVAGYVAIKKNLVIPHKGLMILATLTSAFFLISYITYHHFHGDTKFLGEGAIRPVYFFILITHIILSIVQVPLILITLYLAFMKKYVRHRTFARITFPIWLYVSITGVLIFLILKNFNPAVVS